MSSTDNTEKMIRFGKPRIETGNEMDKQVIEDSFAAMDETIRAKSAAGKPNTWKMIVQSKTTKVAAATIIVAIGLFVVRREPGERPATTKIPKVTKSPAELTTFASLTFAYRQGGIELVEQMCDRAITLAGPRPVEISVQDLLEESNGSNSERTRL
jgi:predicted RNA-binding Zn ribbon-like protein